MADELTLSMSVRYSKNGLSLSQNVTSFNVTVSGDQVASGTQAVGTSAENLEKGDITTSGWLLIQNLDLGSEKFTFPMFGPGLRKNFSTLCRHFEADR